MTHYRYHLASVRFSRSSQELDVSVRPEDGQADLRVTADLETARLPTGSVFPDERTARRFAGPMPFTFSYEPETGSILRIEGVRSSWTPELVDARVEEAGFLSHLGLDGEAKLAAAFTVEEIPYRWQKAIVTPAKSPSDLDAPAPRRPLEGVANIVRFKAPVRHQRPVRLVVWS